MFGPALIHAYELESRTAKFPRVIVTDEALPYIDPVITLPEEGATTHFYNVRKDMDEWAYVDILGFCAGHKNEPRHPPAFPLAKSIDTVRERVRGDAEDPDRLAKHEWMLRYLEDVQRACAGHPLSESASTAPGVSSSA